MIVIAGDVTNLLLRFPQLLQLLLDLLLKDLLHLLLHLLHLHVVVLLLLLHLCEWVPVVIEREKRVF